MYAIGGRQGPLGSELAETDAYDIASRAWRYDLASLPTPRGGVATAALGGRIFVIGGETPYGVLRTVDAYDPRGDRWRTVDPVPTARHGIQAACTTARSMSRRAVPRPAGSDPVSAFEAYVPGTQPPGPRFTLSFLEGAKLTNPTSLQLGPDGRLYVSQQDGLIKAFTVVRHGPGDYRVTSTETIDAIQSIPNHDDDGS